VDQNEDVTGDNKQNKDMMVYIGHTVPAHTSSLTTILNLSESFLSSENTVSCCSLTFKPI